MKMQMEIRKATTQDLPDIMEVIGQARTIMRETGNATQWANGYPSAQTILDDIAQDCGFVCTTDAVVGYFFFRQGAHPEPTYTHIEGQWLNDEPYGVIHRLASGRKAKGIAQAAFDFAFSLVENVRVDTHADNLPMQNFLVKNGFLYCGVIYVNDGTPRDAFQKRQ